MMKLGTILCVSTVAVAAIACADKPTQPQAASTSMRSAPLAQRRVIISRPTRTDINTFSDAVSRDQQERLIQSAVARMATPEAAEGLRRDLTDENTVIVSHPDPLVADAVSKLYSLRAVARAAAALRESRDAASRSSAPLTFAMSSDSRFGAHRATILRNQNRSNTIVVPPNATATDLRNAVLALQSLRANDGDEVAFAQTVAVDIKRDNAPTAADRYNHYLERLRASGLREVDGVGQAKAFSLRLIAVRNAPKMVDATK